MFVELYDHTVPQTSFVLLMFVELYDHTVPQTLFVLLMFVELYGHTVPNFICFVDVCGIVDHTV